MTAHSIYSVRTKWIWILIVISFYHCSVVSFTILIIMNQGHLSRKPYCILFILTLTLQPLSWCINNFQHMFMVIARNEREVKWGKERTMDINVLFSFWMRISGLEQDIEYGNDQCQFFMTLVYMLIVLTRNCIQGDNCIAPKLQELSDRSRNVPLLLPIKAAEELKYHKVGR